MKTNSLCRVSIVKEVPPDLFKTIANKVAWRVLPCLIGLSPMAQADVLYEENFDRPIVTTGLSATDPRIGWVGWSSTVLVQDTEPKLSGKSMDGSSASTIGVENMFFKSFPAVTSGTVSLSCKALAKSVLSISSCIGLTHKEYAQRQAQWTCVPGGWAFYVGRIDQTGKPYSDIPLGTPTHDIEYVTVPYDTPVTLRVFVNQDTNKAWGVAEWVAGGVPQSHTTAQYDWDIGLSEVSTIFVSQDRRDGKIGIDLDDIKVEGVRHQMRPHPFLNNQHTIYQMNGTAGALPSNAEIYWPTRDWPMNAQMPYLAWMPEQSKLVMLFYYNYPPVSATMSSTDGGVTWSEPSLLPTGATSALGMVNLGGGELFAMGPITQHNNARSTDYGVTWTGVSPGTALTPEVYFWDPPVVLGPAGGGLYHLAVSGWSHITSPAPAHSQGYIRYSSDSGATWGPPEPVSQWTDVNEVTLIKAANGNLIAAGRTDNPDRFDETQVDQYSGLTTWTGVWNTTTNKYDWSVPNKLFEWGRHHPSMVVLPNGDVVMTYIVRMGYTPDEKGFPQFGVEAVISKNDGDTWDLDHRIILAKWSGNVKGDKRWYGGVQSTSSVLLPDGTIVTAFGTGFENAPETKLCQMDVALVRWQVPSHTLNTDTYLSSRPYNSDARNILNPRLPIAKKVLKTPFSMGYGWTGGSWSTTETSSVNTPPGSGFSLTANLSGVTGSNTGPSFTNRVLGTILTSTAHQASIVDDFEAELVAAYTGSAPADVATKPNYQVSLNIHNISIRNAPNIVGTGQTINFYEVTPGYEVAQDPQAAVETGNFTMLPTWNKMSWDPKDPLSMAALLTQQRTRTFVLEQDAYYNMFIDGLEIEGEVSLTYDSVTPTSRQTITVPFSMGWGWKSNTWNTTETSAVNVSPGPDFVLNVDFGSPGNGTMSNTGPTFSNRVLGAISTSTSHQCGYPPGFALNVSGQYIGVVPANAAANPNYKVKVVVDSLSVHSAPILLTAGQTLNFNETTSGHTQAQSPQSIPTGGNFTVLSSWNKYAWNPTDYDSSTGPLQQTQTRSFTLTQVSSADLVIDGLEITGHLELSYDAVP